MTNKRVAVVGATGTLGLKVARALLLRDADVLAIVRPGTSSQRLSELRALGVGIVEAGLDDDKRLTEALTGAACVVSTVSGLADTIVAGQTKLLEAAVAAAVPKFVPSDFCISFHQVPRGSNRNIDLRREFKARLDQSPIAATSIFNGCFETLLLMSGPFIAYPIRRVMYWEDADHEIDFTQMDDVARYTAAAALDAQAPRELHIASSRLTARDLAALATEFSGRPFTTFRCGGVRTLGALIAATRFVYPQRDTPFSVWQGLQYIRNTFDASQSLPPLDNDRYPGEVRIPVSDMLRSRFTNSERAAETQLKNSL